MKLSEGAKRIADEKLKKESLNIKASYQNILDIDEMYFVMTNFGYKNEIFSHYIHMTEELVRAKVNSYLDAFTNENLIPDKVDIDEIILELENLIRDVSIDAPDEIGRKLSGESNRIIFSAQQELRIFSQEMRFEQESRTNHNITYNNTYNAQVTGMQQGGRNNTQNNTIKLNPNLSKTIIRFLRLIENSSLNSLDKITTKANIQTIELLAKIEQTSEVLEEITERIRLVREKISETSDVASIGLGLLHIIQNSIGLFGIRNENDEIDKALEFLRDQEENLTKDLVNEIQESSRIKQFLKQPDTSVLYEGIEFKLLLNSKLVIESTMAIRRKIDKAFPKSELTTTETNNGVIYTLIFTKKYQNSFELTQRIGFLKEQGIEVVIIGLD